MHGPSKAPTDPCTDMTLATSRCMSPSTKHAISPLAIPCADEVDAGATCANDTCYQTPSHDKDRCILMLSSLSTCSLALFGILYVDPSRSQIQVRTYIVGYDIMFIVT